MSTDPRSHDQQSASTPEDSAQSGPDQFEMTYGERESLVCLSCGYDDIPQDVGRVYGNNNDNVEACAHCWTDAQGNSPPTTHAAAAMHAITEDRL